MFISYKRYRQCRFQRYKPYSPKRQYDLFRKAIPYHSFYIHIKKEKKRYNEKQHILNKSLL